MLSRIVKPGKLSHLLPLVPLALLFLYTCMPADKNVVAPFPAGPSFSAIVDEVMPSVVYIYVEKEKKAGKSVHATTGSGVIMQSNGFILTNRHVIEGMARAEVTLQNREVYEVTGMWIDDVLDLAVVKINAKGLPFASFGDPDQIEVGDWVVALGHPLGLSPDKGGVTVTAGIISNLGRSFVVEGIPYYDVIQIDAAINPGNSGGPLINTDGEVIGINSLGIGEAQNINYAINISTAQRVYDDIIRYGRVVRPYFGAIMTDVTPVLACEYCLENRVGALIIDVEEGTPADKAGLERYDVIISFGDMEVTSVALFLKEVWRQEIGASKKIIFWRESETMSTNVVLSERTPTGILQR